jgi:hypothetical protein
MPANAFTYAKRTRASNALVDRRLKRVLAPIPPEGLRSVFEAHLHGAITRGRMPPGNVGLGPDT